MPRNGTTKTTIGIIVVLFIVLAWGIAFGFIKRDVFHINEQSNENKSDIKIMDTKVDTITNAITRIDTRQEVMIKGIEEINEKLK